VDEAKAAIDGLLDLQGQLHNGDEAIGFNDKIDAAIGLIHRLAAEVERLRPREMTLNEAASVLTQHGHRRCEWIANAVQVVAIGCHSILNEIEAIAVAEKLLRDRKEAAK
jgi:hypothetical protein